MNETREEGHEWGDGGGRSKFHFPAQILSKSYFPAIF
jgi:hypothetical protein